MINVISGQQSRRKQLAYELLRQKGDHEVKFWPAIYKATPCEGISQAHKQIVRWAKDHGLPDVWIIEDDIKVISDEGFNQFLKHKPSEFDLYLGGASSLKYYQDKISKFSGLHCYMVASKFYDQFLSADETQHLDYALSMMRPDIRIFPIAIQYPGHSENTKKVENYTKRFIL